jgi:hypothetical protein
MKSQFLQNMRITRALLSRDLYVFRSTMMGTIIDAAISLCTEIILNVKLLPLMGMPRELIAPLYIGGIFAKLFFLAHSYSLRIQYGIKNGGLPLYEATLPLAKSWLFARNVIRFVIETLLILVPLTVASIPLVGADLGINNPNWIALLFFSVASALFFGALSIFIAHHYPFDWYMENIWPRRLSFLFMTSVLFVTWKRTMLYVPWFGYMTLLNPTTYLVEGMRNALFDQNLYLPQSICIVGSLFFCIIIIILMYKSIIKRLDLV